LIYASTIALTAGITTPSYRRPQLLDFQSFAACVLFNLPTPRVAPDPLSDTLIEFDHLAPIEPRIEHTE
jgi:hypothetical protein